MLKPVLFLSVVALLAFAPSAAPAAPPQAAAPDASNPAKSSPQSRTKAKELYQRDCALCHGDSGDGKTDLAKDMQLTMADWTDPKSLAGQTDQQLFDIIRHGKEKMPAEESGRASDADVRALVLYIRSLAKDQPSTPPAPAAPTAVTGAATPNR